MNSKRKNNNEENNKNLNVEKQVLGAFGDLKIEKEGNKEAAWQRFSETITEGKQISGLTTRKLAFYAVAASLVLVLSLSFLFFYQTKTTYSSANAEIQQYKFPDSSLVILNADSKVHFKKFAWNKKRIVSLEGEAFFDVKHGGEFIVETGEATITVPGTTFNVYSREGLFSVKCKTGKIVVKSKLFESLDTLSTMEALDIAIDKFKGAKKYTITETDATAWINGEFYYNDVPLGNVLKELERQFNVQVNTSATIESRHYSGYFRNDDLTQALEYICSPMDLNYDMNEKNLIRIY